MSPSNFPASSSELSYVIFGDGNARDVPKRAKSVTNVNFCTILTDLMMSVASTGLYDYPMI